MTLIGVNFFNFCFRRLPFFFDIYVFILNFILHKRYCTINRYEFEDIITLGIQYILYRNTVVIEILRMLFLA